MERRRSMLKLISFLVLLFLFPIMGIVTAFLIVILYWMTINRRAVEKELRRQTKKRKIEGRKK